MSYKEKLVKIKNFVFDVDGVFTDGSIIVDNQGNEFRVFSTRDGIAVKLGSHVINSLINFSPLRYSRTSIEFIPSQEIL